MLFYFKFQGIKVSPLLQAIAFNKIEAAKYLIFRNADIHLQGEVSAFK
jgi:hypothetical protein